VRGEIGWKVIIGGVRGRLVLLALALLSLGCVFAPSAGATLYFHPQIGAFGPKGPGNLFKFTQPEAAVFDNTSNNIYVYDVLKEGSTREIGIYRFDAAGNPVNFTAGSGAGKNVFVLSEPSACSGSSEGCPQPSDLMAVAPAGSKAGTAGDLYVFVAGDVEVYSSTGAHLGTIDGSGNPATGSARANGIATDSMGNLYIAYPEHLDKYVPVGNPVVNGDFDSALHFNGNVCDAAIAAASLYVSLGHNGCPTSRYPLAFPGGGGSVSPVAEGSISGEAPLAIDSANWFLYGRTRETYGFGVDGHHAFGYEQYDEEGHPISFIDPGNDGVLGKIGIAPSSGHLYLPVRILTERDVRIYGDGEPVQPPIPTIDPVSDFDYRSAHFTGVVNPGASGPLQETAYRFTCEPECPGLEGERTVSGDGNDHLVSDDAIELQPETHYKVTLLARNMTFFPGFGPATVKSTTSFDTAAKPPAEAPEVSIDPVTSFGAESAHLTGSINPRGSGELQATTYRFEYSSDGLIWKSAGAQGPIEGGPQAVFADLTGLEPNTTYIVRLEAENVGGSAVSVAPNPTFTTTSAVPEVEITGATQVQDTSARLNGRVNPRNTTTSYYFEWGSADCASNPCMSIPTTQDGEAGAGGESVWVAAQVQGLTPGQQYSYRLVAKNAAGQEFSASRSFTAEAAQNGCANEELRVGLSAALADCRAYEMVSPVDKGGGNVATQVSKTRVASDGNAVTFRANAAFAGAIGAPFAGNEYISVRDSEGWSTHAINPYQAAPYDVTRRAFAGPGFTGQFSSDLEDGVYLGESPVPGATSENVDEQPNLFLGTGMRKGMPTFTLLSDSQTPLGPFQGGQGPEIGYVDASDDFRKIAFESHNNLTADASGGALKLYEWDQGSVRLAGILPESSCASPPCPAPESVGGGGALFFDGNPEVGNRTDTDHVVSADGSKVFFTAGSGQPGGETYALQGGIYARIDGNTTVQIDASERTVSGTDGSGRSRFGAASADGNIVYFTSQGPLVDGVNSGGLYSYDFRKPVGERLTAISMPHETSPGGIEVAGISQSGDFAYVRSGSEIVVVHNGKSSVVASISLHETDPLLFDNDAADQGSFRVSPTGRYAVFLTVGNVLNYESRNTDCYHAECAQVYLFSYDSGELRCLSCNFGHQANGESTYSNGRIGTLSPDRGFPGMPQPNANHPLADNGRYVFFSTREALDPRDTNGKYDAYVYDTEKEEPRLISSGQCNCDSFFISASPDGQDAFFTTYQQLVRADVDSQADLYDARIGGGLAAQNKVPQAECQGDACQAAPTPPNDPTPASSSFVGAGNQVPCVKSARNGPKGRRKHRKHQRCGSNHSRKFHAKKGGSK
jgi:hypothetical protein